jgi:hypothetical protein
MILTEKAPEMLTANEEPMDTLIGKESENGILVQHDTKDLKMDEEHEDYKSKYEREHLAFETYKNEQRQKEIKAAKERAFREIIEAAGISKKRVGAVLRVSDLDTLLLDENGKAKNGEELARKIREEFSDFVITEMEMGVQVMTPPDCDDARDLGKLDMAAYIAERKRTKKG